MLLPNHCPVGQDLPRGPRRNLERIHSHPGLTSAQAQSRCRLIPWYRASAGHVCQRVEGVPRGDHGVSKAGVRELFGPLTKRLPPIALSPLLSECVYTPTGETLVGRRLQFEGVLASHSGRTLLDFPAPFVPHPPSQTVIGLYICRFGNSNPMCGRADYE